MSEEKKDLTSIFELTEENELPGSEAATSQTSAPSIEQTLAAATFEMADSATENPFSDPPAAPEETQMSVQAEAQQEDPPLPEDVGPHEPFDLWIDGPMTAEEKAKLIEILETEKFGIREGDIELQLQGIKVRIPRISEYAGVLLVQALRASRAVFRLVPTQENFMGENVATYASGPVQSEARSEKPVHPAENIPVVASPTLSHSVTFVTIDMLSASASFSSTHMHPNSSTEYQSLLEALQRELKYKAYRKKADAVVNFQVQLIPLTLPTEYKMVASGTAVKYTSS